MRIYLLEGERQHHRSTADTILERLFAEHRIRGATQFRGISGFGSRGVIHFFDLAHVNAHLPTVIEFSDEESVVEQALIWIRELVADDKIVSWRL